MTASDVPEAAQAQLLAAVDTALAKPQAAQGFLNTICLTCPASAATRTR